MGIFSFLGNIGAGIQGSRMGKKQMQLGQGMIDEAQALSSAYARPEMRTPAAIQAMMELSSGRRFENMPGMSLLQNQINQATAGGVKAMERMGVGAEGIGGVAKLYANQLNQQSDVAYNNAMFRDQNVDKYLGDLNTLGDWQQKSWEWNAADPYLMAQQKAAMLETAGRQGQWEGLKNKMGSWAETFQGVGSSLDSLAQQAGNTFTGGLFGKIATVAGGAAV